MRNGELYERPMLVDPIGESGRLCWPTARSQDSKHGEATDYEMSREEGLDLLHVKAERMMRMWPTARSEDSESCGNHPGAVDSLTGAARMWRTPRVANIKGSAKRLAQGSNESIESQAQMWMTPNLPLGGRKNTAEQVQAKGKTDSGKRQISLEGQTMHWPTPQARDVKSPDMEGSGNYERKVENGWTIDLNSAAANWPTPATRDWKSGEASEETLNRNARPLSEIASHFSLPDLPTSTPGGKSPSGSTRRLNPDFVDWLMGLIPEWTDYAPLETASYLSRVRSLLRSFLGGYAK